jgi:uncharacterized protein (DUF427 family)
MKSAQVPAVAVSWHRGGMSIQAIWHGTVIAESDDTVVVENNHYFPLDSVRQDVLRPSQYHTLCPWKGTASYYSIEVDGKRNEDAAWFYPEPKDAAAQIKDHVAFWRGVEVTA